MFGSMDLRKISIKHWRTQPQLALNRNLIAVYVCADGLLSVSWKSSAGGIMREGGAFMPYCMFPKLHYAGHFQRGKEQACGVSNMSIIPADIENILPSSILTSAFVWHAAGEYAKALTAFCWCFPET